MNSVIEKSGTYKGFTYEVRALFYGWRCGYVDLPDRLIGYFSYGDDVTDSLDVHGGITFVRDKRIGFDCNHYGDALDTSIMNDESKNEYRERYDFEESPTIKDSTYVEKECKKLIDQLINLKTPYEKGFEDGKKATLSWLPIESAPKEGKERDVFKRPRVLVIDKEGKVHIGYLKEYWDYGCPSIGYYWAFEGDDNMEILNVIGWLPLSVLPLAPEADRC